MQSFTNFMIHQTFRWNYRYCPAQWAECAMITQFTTIQTTYLIVIVPVDRLMRVFNTINIWYNWKILRRETPGRILMGRWKLQKRYKRCIDLFSRLSIELPSYPQTNHVYSSCNCCCPMHSCECSFHGRTSLPQNNH